MIRIGTSGYSFDDWVGRFYPPGTPRGRMLEHYARFFDTVEINATYYRIPAAKTFAGMVARTPHAFTFLVKAHRSATHDRADMDRETPGFLAAIAPLRDAGKLGGVLLQFPWAFRHGRVALDHLARARAAFGRERLFAEFRHDSWDRDDTFAFLSDHDIGYCAVDEPDLPGLMPPRVRVTSDEGYVRFHGRNREAWWGSTRKPGQDRYDHRYTDSELREWAGRVRALARRTTRTWVFFNNCHEGQAVDGARMMAAILEDMDGDDE